MTERSILHQLFMYTSADFCAIHLSSDLTDTYPIEHHVSALASDLSMDCLYEMNASWTFPILE